MVAHGEIRLFNSSIADSQGHWSIKSDKESLRFLIITWAIFLCTNTSPVAMSMLFKQVRRLKAAERSNRIGREDALGMWYLIEKH